MKQIIPVNKEPGYELIEKEIPEEITNNIIEK